MVAVNVTFCEPSKDTLPVKSPASPISLAVVSALAVLAVTALVTAPEILPTKVVAVITFPLKLPEASLLTNLFAVFTLVALSISSV